MMIPTSKAWEYIAWFLFAYAGSVILASLAIVIHGKLVGRHDK